MAQQKKLSGTLYKQGDCCVKGDKIYYGMSGEILGSNKIMWGMYKLMGRFRDGPKEEEGRG